MVKLIVEHLIVTIPRTGSNYLQNLIYQKIDCLYYVEKTHKFPEEHKNIITIVRDPKDTIISELAMNHSYGLPITERKILDRRNNYILLGKKLYNEAKIIIDYNDLINYPNEVIKYIAKDMKRPYKDIDYKNDLKDTEDKSYLVTSKNTPYYTKFKLLIDTLNFNRSYEVYHKLLSKAINVQTSSI